MSQFTFLRALVVAVAVALVAMPAGALGAKPEIVHERVFEAAEDEDVCGVTVDIVTRGVFTDRAFFDQEGKMVRFTSTGAFKSTFTDAEGDAVIVQSAGQRRDDPPVIDEVARTVTVVSTFKGLPEKIKTPHGRILLRDAGVIAFADTFDLDTGDFISSDVIINKGPHPEADSNFTLFCEVITEALA